MKYPSPRPIIGHQEPLEDRVDKDGVCQCKDPAKARRSRAQGRVDAAIADGCEPDESDVEMAGDN